MRKFSATRTMSDKNDEMSGGWDTTEVVLTRREAALLKERDEDTIERLFEVADVMGAYYGGAGRAFIHPPSFHVEWRKMFYYKPVAVVNQHFGFDI